MQFEEKVFLDLAPYFPYSVNDSSETMDNDEYTEKLAFGGTLKVTKQQWLIEYYFPGPDRRYNGDLKKITGGAIDFWIDAFEKAWHQCEELSAALPAESGWLTRTGPGGLTLTVGGGRPSVSYHVRMVISSTEELTRLLDSFRYAKAKAAEIQQLLFA